MWQHWYEQHGPVDFIAVAADAQGPKAAQPWVERAGATFAVAVDSENKLGALLGYTVVPTGVFVDEKGAVRHLQAGDFSVRDEHTLARVERFLAGDLAVLAELSVESSSRLEPLAQELVDAKVSLASELLARADAGTKHWRPSTAHSSSTPTTTSSANNAGRSATRNGSSRRSTGTGKGKSSRASAKPSAKPAKPPAARTDARSHSD